MCLVQSRYTVLFGDDTQSHARDKGRKMRWNVRAGANGVATVSIVGFRFLSFVRSFVLESLVLGGYLFFATSSETKLTCRSGRVMYVR